jgi:hypothetical protein
MEFSYRMLFGDGTPSPKGEKGWDLLSFKGNINEDAELVLPKLLQEIKKDTIFDLYEITGVNSCGIRAWVHFIRGIEKNNLKLIFRRCPPEIVSQINMIPNFKGKGIIESVYAAYLCPSCQAESLHLFEQGRNMPSAPSDSLEEVFCPKCRSPMEMEELEEEFFAWIEG